jgi:hypothetical protein
MRRYGLGLVGLVVLALVSLLFLSACILVPVDDGRGRGDRDRHGDEREQRDRHDQHDQHEEHER